MNPYYNQNAQSNWANYNLNYPNQYGLPTPLVILPSSSGQNPTQLRDRRQLNEEDEKTKPQKNVSNSKFNAFAKSFTPLTSTSTPSFAPSIQQAREEDGKVSNSSSLISKSSTTLPSPNLTLTTATTSLLSSSSSVSSAADVIFSITPVKPLEPSQIQTAPPSPQSSAFIELDPTILDDETMYGIYISTSRRDEITPVFDYNNVILCEYQLTTPKKVGSNYLKFQLDNGMQLWLSEKKELKPMLLYKVGNKTLHENPHVFLDSRRKYHFTWPNESNVILNYEIWTMNDNLKRGERVFSSSEGIIFNHLYQVPFTELYESVSQTAAPLESKPGINPEEFEKEVGYSFKDPKLLDLVLNHNIIRAEIGNNRTQQRLKVLGDAVLHFIIIKLWYDDSSLTTDHWSAMQAFLSNHHGKQYLTQLGILKFTKLPPSKQMFGSLNSNRKQYMDLFEVLIGAIYLDKDFNTAQAYYLRNFQKYLEASFQKPIEQVDQTKKEESLQKKPLISIPIAPDIRTYQNPETFDQITGPSLQKLEYKFKNPKILEQLKNTDNILNFKKIMTLSSCIKKFCILDFLYKNFTDDTEELLTVKLAKLFKRISTSVPEEVIAGIYLDSGLESIRSIIDSWCNKTAKDLFTAKPKFPPVNIKSLRIKKNSLYRLSYIKDYTVDKSKLTELTTEFEDDALAIRFENLHLKQLDGGNLYIHKIYKYGISKNQPAFVKKLQQIGVHSFKAIVFLKDDLQAGIGIGDSRLKAIATACIDLMQKKNLSIQGPEDTLYLYLQDQIIDDYQLQVKRVDETSSRVRAVIHLNGEEIAVMTNCKINKGKVEKAIKEVAEKAIFILDSKLPKTQIVRTQPRECKISLSKLTMLSIGENVSNEKIAWKNELANVLDSQKSWSPFYNTYKIKNGFECTLYAGEGLIEIGHGRTKFAAEEEAAEALLMTYPTSVLEDYKQYNQMKKVEKSTTK